MSSLDLSSATMKLFGEPARIRLLALLFAHRLSVAELTAVTGMTQSRVSTHLGKLRDAGVVHDERVGNLSYYSLNEIGMPAMASRLWGMLREGLDDDVVRKDSSRALKVVEARRKGKTWMEAVAGEMERHYSPGRTWHATTYGLLGLARAGDVLDVASGDGVLSELIALRAKTVTCLDSSETLIEAARRRLAHRPNVRCVQGDMHALPFEDSSFDNVMLLNCLTYSRAPATAIMEAARVLRPGGTISGVTLAVHRHENIVETYNHVNLGFEAANIAALLDAADLRVECCEVTVKEQKQPYFEIITFYASKDQIT